MSPTKKKTTPASKKKKAVAKTKVKTKAASGIKKATSATRSKAKAKVKTKTKTKTKAAIKAKSAKSLRSRRSSVLDILRLHEKDTGSAAVQIGIFTKKIEQLTRHLKIHSKDHHSRRGLIKMVAKRRKLLDYLRRTDEKTFKAVKDRLGLK